MKIAIISDIHGNLEALKATLKDIEKRKVDKIICLGDIIAKGVHPKECIELIRKNCEIVLQGNCDIHFSSEHNNISTMPEQEQKRGKRTQRALPYGQLPTLFPPLLPYMRPLHISELQKKDRSSNTGGR